MLVGLLKRRSYDCDSGVGWGKGQWTAQWRTSRGPQEEREFPLCWLAVVQDRVEWAESSAGTQGPSSPGCQDTPGKASFRKRIMIPTGLLCLQGISASPPFPRVHLGTAAFQVTYHPQNYLLLWAPFIHHFCSVGYIDFSILLPLDTWLGTLFIMWDLLPRFIGKETRGAGGDR